MNVWECDLMDMHSLCKYNDKYNLLLCVIDTSSNTYISYRCGQRRVQPCALHFVRYWQCIGNRYADVLSGCEQIGA